MSTELVEIIQFSHGFRLNFHRSDGWKASFQNTLSFWYWVPVNGLDVYRRTYLCTIQKRIRIICDASLSNCGLKIKNERPLLCVVSGSVNRQMHRLGEIEMTKMVNWIKWIQTSSSIFHAYIYGKSGPGRPGCRASGRLGHWVAGPWAGAGGRAPALAKPTSSTEGCGI